MTSDGDSCEVGYGKPPKEHRFKPKQSGNPKGRPKAPPKFEDLLAKELNKKVKVTVDGKQKTLTKAEVVVKAVVQKAMKADAAAAKLVLSGLQAYPHADEGEAALTPEELELIKELLGTATAEAGDGEAAP